ncbi:NADPH:quinone oxidoreductase [Sorangium cellulosum]|uniref:NADPH:quinone oxidoreductase n=1 Tax=Sorangium cellulosum TaxID=56 RepID=A0A2L0ESQ5_SORCE|nr:zinc-binding dehydrogenase [Sorangium cellulosum]AUX42348.1 NADPH:quinone oxidoreductase [Sorangium cellulosum]
MRAALLTSSPGAEGAAIGERDPGPVPREHVRVRVAFAGVNHIDLLIADGKLALAPRPAGLGLELAGTVEALGEGARGPAVGARVVAMGTPFTGAFAELADVEARRAVLVPDGVPLDRAAASVVTYATAWTLLRDRARIAPGETVLVYGAAGGVGTAALQLARHLGARPIALVGDPSKGDHAARHGAASAIDHRREDVAARVRALTDGRGVDVVLNAAGGATLARDLGLLAPFGRLVCFGFLEGPPGGAELGAALAEGFGRSVSLAVSDLFTSYREAPERFSRTVEEVLALVARGALEPAIHATWPLERVGEALDALRARAVHGKVLLRCAA